MREIVCITCKKLGTSCPGPQFAAMDPADVSDWIRERKKVLGLTNAAIAEASGVPLSTVNRMLTGQYLNYKLDTIAPILTVLVGGDWPTTICADPDGSELHRTRERVHHLETELAATRASAGQAHDAAQDNAGDLRAQVRQYRRLCYALGIVLFLVLVGIIGLLLYDLTNLSVGYFRG